MAFGFPAYHSDTYTVRSGRCDLYDAVLDTLDDLGWSILEEDDDTIEASTNVSFWSWGERITIKLKANKVRITSRCVLPTQCFDWGKNQSNVNTFLTELRRYLR